MKKKRKRNDLDRDQKREIINYNDLNPSKTQAEVAEFLGNNFHTLIGRTAICDLNKKETRERLFSNDNFRSLGTKRLKSCQNSVFYYGIQI